MTLPLTPGQSSIWFGQATRPGTSLYQCAELLIFDGQPDTDLLERTIASCLQQLPALQSEFREGPDGAPQMVPASREHTVRREVFRGEESELLTWAQEQIRVPAMTQPGLLSGEELSGQILVEIPDAGERGSRWAWLARFHHILGDGFAVHAIIRWVAACFTAAAAGEEQPEPPFLSPEEALQNQQDYEASEQAQADRDFWQQAVLRVDPPSLALRPAAAGEEIHSAEAGISPETRRRLRSLARKLHGAAGETELLAAVAAHYTAVISGAAVEGEEVVLGLPLMNRPMGQARVALDPAVNVLPLRLSGGVGADASEGGAADSAEGAAAAGLGAQLAEASEQLGLLRRHGMRRAEQIRRDRSIADPTRRLTGPGLNIKPFASQFRFGETSAALTTVAVGPVEDADLLMQARPDGGFQLRILANAAAHTAQEAQDHADRLASLLEQLAARAEEQNSGGLSPDQLNGAQLDLNQLDLALPAERRQVIEEFNATERELTVPQDSTLTSLLRARRDADLAASAAAGASADSGISGPAGSPAAADTSDPADSPALLWQGEGLSRQEVWAQVDALADQLRNLGAGPGVLVGVQLRRGPALPLTLAAVVACGAAWVPLDPDQPEARRGLMVETAGPGLIVRGEEPLPEPASGLPALRLDESSLRPADALVSLSDAAQPSASQSDAAQPETDPTQDVPLPSPEDLAYVLFTSGSTGTPKGVAVSQGAIVNRLEWKAADYAITVEDVILQKTPCSFDVSVWEFMLPFTHGARLAVAPDGAHRDPAALAAELARAEVTTCHFVPSALKAFLDGSGVSSAEQLPALRQVFASGEALEPGLARRFAQTLGVQLHNLYGPTEAAVDVTAHTYVPGEAEVPIGAPVWNTRCYVLDEALRPVPVGVAGQLYLAGVQLAEGYIGREDLTAERFIPDPFRPGERMYATGDIARWRADGELLYYGRADSQVKLRGQRIELGEIEAVLAEHPAVGQCAVTAREVAGEQTLIGYLVLDELSPELEAELRAHLGAALPGYMVPAALMAVDALPTTLNGKLDAGRLPLPERGAGEWVSAESPLEHAVQQAFAQVLELDRVSATENFFDAGGSSLSAVRLASQVSEATGVELGIADVFAAPTVRELAARVTAAGAAEAGAGASRAGAGAEAADPFGPLLTLRRHASGTPVFCFHPAGGLGWSYAGLLPRLERDRGVYALQSPGLTCPEQRPASLAEAAERAADAVQQVLAQTGGSAEGAGDSEDGALEADLVGWSVGGVLAQAVGVVLERRGVRTRRLVLMDAYPAELWQGRAAPTEKERLEGLLIMAGVDAPEDLELTQQGVVSAIRETGSPFASLPEPVLHGVTEMVGHNARLMREHTTEAFPGRAQMFAAALNPEPFEPEAWQPHLGALEVTALECTHPGMVSPDSLDHIAAALR